MKIRTVKIHWEFMSFLRITENDVFGTSGARSFLDQNFPRTVIIYYKYYITGSLRGCRATSTLSLTLSLRAVPPSPVLPHPHSETPCDSFFAPVELDGNTNIVKTQKSKPTSGQHPKGNARNKRIGQVSKTETAQIEPGEGVQRLN